MMTLAVAESRVRKSPRVNALNVPSARRTLALSLFRIAKFGLILVVTAVIIAGAGSFYFFSQYNAMVVDRVRSGFWQSRGGVYAAESELRVGQRMTPDALAERLRLSGYIEGSKGSEIWNGTFTVDGETINIEPSTASTVQGGATAIQFSGDKISDIRSRGYKRETFMIEPELLIGRSQAKRTADRVLDFDSIPVHLRNAILAAEDQRFFSHYGIDPKGIARAFRANLSEGRVAQGGSTITQQLAKNTFLSPERSYRRKIEEAFLSLALEQNLSKEQIFALYCNEIYLGQYGSTSVHGVEQAARVYFGKELSDLSLAESAAIAGMIKNPSTFGPHKDAQAAKARRETIIQRMVVSGAVKPEQVELAVAADLKLREPMKKPTSTAPYFIDTALKSIEGGFDGEFLNSNLNMRVYTTLNTQMQRAAEKAVADHLAKLNSRVAKGAAPLQAALVSMDPHTGRVLAMVGGSDYQASQFNRAADAMRQPGSTFKPIVYATALERGLTPITTFTDAPQDFMHVGSKPYRPENYGKAYTRKPMTLKTAMVRSSNVVAVHTAFTAGYRRVAEKAKEFGFENVEAYPSIALGAVEVTPMQLATAYAAFANGGKRVNPVLIDRIVSGSGKTLYQYTKSDERLLSEQNAYMITDMLKGVVEQGTAKAANGALGANVAVAGKTGSSRDGWFVGYTPNLVTAVWVGYDDPKDVRATGGEIALPLWVDFMKSAIRANPEFGGSSFDMPAGLVSVTIDPETGMLADSMCPLSQRAVVKASSAPNVKCIFHQPKIESLYAVDLSEEFPEEPAASEISAEEIPLLDETDVQPRTTVEAPEPEVPVVEPEKKPQKVDGKDVVVRETVYGEYLGRIARKPR